MARPNQSAEKRGELIPLISRAFAELGYRRTTTAELARRCGVRENILYRLWPDKKAMFVAAIEYVYELSASIWTRLLADDPAGSTPAELLLEYEACHHGEFGFYRIIFAGLSEADDPAIREALRLTFLRFHEFITRQIGAHRKGAQSGKMPDEILSAWAFLGLGTVSNISRELGLLDPADRIKLIRKVGKLILEGR